MCDHVVQELTSKGTGAKGRAAGDPLRCGPAPAGRRSRPMRCSPLRWMVFSGPRGCQALWWLVLEQDLRVAQDAVERRAQLMGHAGDVAGLGLVGGFGQLLGLPAIRGVGAAVGIDFKLQAAGSGGWSRLAPCAGSRRPAPPTTSTRCGQQQERVDLDEGARRSAPGGKVWSPPRPPWDRSPRLPGNRPRPARKPGQAASDRNTTR